MPEGFSGVHQILCRVTEIRIFRNVNHRLLLAVTVGIFFKGGTHKAHRAGLLGHKGLNQLSGAVAHQHIFQMDAKILRRQQRIDPHTGGVLRQKLLKAGFQLVDELLGREVGVYQIAEVQQLGVSPITAVAVRSTFSSSSGVNMEAAISRS